MNPMIAALQKSRKEGPADMSPMGGPGKMPDMPMPEGKDGVMEKCAAMDAKLDMILKLLGATQNAGEPEESAEKETTPNDDGN